MPLGGTTFCEPYPTRSMPDTDHDDFDGEMLETALEENRRTLDQKNKTFRELSRKADRILYLNVATLAALATAFQVRLFPSSTLLVVPFAGLVGSLVFGVAGYWTAWLHQGTGQAVLEEAIERDYSKNELVTWLILTVYPNGIDRTHQSISRKRFCLKGSLAAYAGSIVLFSAWFLVYAV